MKINIVLDDNLEIECRHLNSILNSNSNWLTFEVSYSTFDMGEDVIVLPETHHNLYRQISAEDRSAYFNFLFTEIPYGNNYFYESYDNLVPFSLYNWNYLTNLPLENGVLYFIISFLARQLDNDQFRHQESTGCLYDFLGDKRGVDDGMRQASFCRDCLDNLEKQDLSEHDQNLLEDLKALMEVLSTSSKWNNSIFKKRKSVSSKITSKRKAINKGIINVVIASPGDLIEERELLLHKLERKFRTDNYEELCNHRLIVHGWEDLASQSGYPQDLINEHIITKMDVVVAVFKHKLGTPTIVQDTGGQRSASGTAEELLIALNNKTNTGPFGMSYFYSKPPSPSFDSQDFDKMRDDWEDLKKFKKSIESKLIYKPFTNKEELLEIVSQDLVKNIKTRYSE